MKIIILLFPVILWLFSGCVSTEKPLKPGSTGVQINKSVLGFGMLSKIPGLWHGPVFSDTPAGSFDNWYVDFRPVSAGQISQYSTLDADTLNYMSFFIVKHGNSLKTALRTEGVFQDKGCVTYEVIDRADEAAGYYRFSDFCAGAKRAYTEFRFAADSFVMEVYTNKFNKEKTLQLHSRWEAKLGSREPAQEAIAYFNYPQQVMIRDFSAVFMGMSESIYFTFENDPYSSLHQPYVGTITVDIAVDKDIMIKNSYEYFLLLTTETLFEGLKYKQENLKYISRYAFLPVHTKSFVFKNMHPGKYYLYSYIDVNNDKKHLSGDYMNSSLDNKAELAANGNIMLNTTIDFQIP